MSAVRKNRKCEGKVRTNVDGGERVRGVCERKYDGDVRSMRGIVREKCEREV